MHIKQIYNTLINSHKNVTIVWVKGHSGIADNERTDALAKDARENGINLTNFKFPSSDVLRPQKERIKRLWSKEYIYQLTKGENTKKFKNANLPNHGFIHAMKDTSLPQFVE